MCFTKPRLCASSALLPLSAEEGEVRVVELFVDGVVHEVFEERCPARHLVGVLAHSLLALRLPDFAPVSLLRKVCECDLHSYYALELAS